MEVRDSELVSLAREIGAVVGSSENCAAEVSHLISGVARNNRILDGLSYRFNSSSYTRELLYEDPDARFSVLALIWQQGQTTPLHAHQTWCAVAVHTGELFETTFDITAGEHAPRQTGERCLQPGSVTYDGGARQAAHQLTNRSSGIAVSLHVYGVPAKHISDGVNIVLDD